MESFFIWFAVYWFVGAILYLLCMAKYQGRLSLGDPFFCALIGFTAIIGIPVVLLAQWGRKIDEIIIWKRRG